MASSGSAALRLSEQIVLARASMDEPTTRAALSSATGLPKATIAAAIASLIGRGLLMEMPGERQGVGRWPGSLRPLIPSGRIFVLDFNREGTTLTVTDPDARTFSRSETALDWAAEVDQLVDELRAKTSPPGPGDSVVVSIPAPVQAGVGIRLTRRPHVDPDVKELHPVPWASWLSNDPARRLTEALGLPVIVENDANLSALGEARYGAGLGLSSTLFVAVRAGLGAGMTIGGDLLRGATGIAGELAHVTIDPDGVLCECGNRGCLVTRMRFEPLLADQIAAAYGHPVSFTDIESLASRQDAGVVRMLDDYGRTVGSALSGFVSLAEPAGVIVDSSLAGAVDAVARGIEYALDRQVQPLVRAGVDVRPGRLGHDAAAHGAVALTRDKWVRDLTPSVPRYVSI